MSWPVALPVFFFVLSASIPTGKIKVVHFFFFLPSQCLFFFFFCVLSLFFPLPLSRCVGELLVFTPFPPFFPFSSSGLLERGRSKVHSVLFLLSFFSFPFSFSSPGKGTERCHEFCGDNVLDVLMVVFSFFFFFLHLIPPFPTSDDYGHAQFFRRILFLSFFVLALDEVDRNQR